ncbi:MAG: FAD-binding oxidoreductase [Alphaproteobacteria bacterium]|nr:FAD-binding oxidoreductase [Alphaproteobacteria bacterium]MBP7759683.1 FAD-binding oxidoreductase [Alphaproteobacteria bacterium]MBP7762868.1 FAD-binding oxidoreductase [Alphaproteobacteria bacterium]MBP7905081.1 FAD-binding oxidoreductase [Alphaproteobacteria bacterium]
MKIAIIGGGITGLTTGLALQEAGCAVHIFSRDPFEKMTSYAAAATSYPYAVEDSPRTRAWHLRNDEILVSLMDDPGAGIIWVNWKKCTLDPHFEIPEMYMRLREARVIGPDECPLGYQKGVQAKLLLMHVGRYYGFLKKKFEAAGGTFTLREIKNFSELERDYDLIVNATGVYARQFVNDETIYPMRGQVVIIKNPGVNFHFASFEGKNYFYPRIDEILIGGSAEVGEWDLTPNDELTNEILGWAKTLDPLLKNPEIVNVRVGLRPMRPQVRIERDENSCAVPVIHNYGQGGAGYTLAWGCAFAARDLALGKKGERAA